MIMPTRKFFATVAIAATAAVVVAGATLRGETREAPTTAETCATVAWPNIPAECLDGAEHGSVRVIGMDASEAATTQVFAVSAMDERFAVAFQ
jgi:hypothetical protein